MSFNNSFHLDIISTLFKTWELVSGFLHLFHLWNFVLCVKPIFVFLLLILIPHSVSHIKKNVFLSWTLSTWKKRSPEHFFSPFYSLSVFLFLPRLHMNFFFSPESFLKCFPRLKNKQMRNLKRLLSDFKHREKTTTKNPHCPSGLSYKGYKEGWWSVKRSRLTLSCLILSSTSLSEKCSTLVSWRSISVSQTRIPSRVPSKSSLWEVKCCSSTEREDVSV